jgi:uncharacterized protein (TIGR00369 family)
LGTPSSAPANSPPVSAPAGGRFEPVDPDYRARVRDSFDRQPAMRLIGAEMTRLDPGFCEIHLPYRTANTQQHGFVHGGVVGMIADSAGGYAAYTLYPAGASILTVEYKLNLLAPARGDTLVARAKVVKPGRTLTVVRADVFAIEGEQEILCATMQQTLITLHGKADR